MDPIFDLAMKLAEKGYGWPAASIGAVSAILTCLKLYLNYKKTHKVEPLRNHVVFNYIKEFCEVSLPVWTGNKSLKSQLIKQCVKIYAQDLSKWLRDEVASDKEWCLEDITSSFVSCMQNVEMKWVSDGVPHIFISKWKEYNLKNIELMNRYIRQASDSSLYDSDRSKKLLVLTLSQFVFFGGLRDLDNRNATLNGELEAALNGKKK
jgi:hypothetical protein